RRRPMRVLMLLEGDGSTPAPDRDIGGKFMRLGNFLDRLEKHPAVDEGERLPRAVRPHGLDRDGARRRRGSALGADAKARRDAVLEHFQDDGAIRGLDPLRFVVAVGGPMSMPVAVMMTAA